MALILSGDLGGTKTILRLSEVHGNGEWKSLKQNVYPSQKYRNLNHIIGEFLGEYTGGNIQVDYGCLGIAGAVINNSALLPNLGWNVDAQELENEFKIKEFKLINDFAAIGYGIPKLESGDLSILHPGKPQKEQTIALVGAGTGLGEAFLVWNGSNYIVVPSEGGNSDFGAQTDRQFALLKYIAKKYDFEQVSVEEVVSGRGIVGIYCFLRDSNFAPESTDIAEAVRVWEKDKTVDPAPMISHGAIHKTDLLSQETMKMFMECYGAETSNVALKSLPYSGIYIAGGIAGKNRSLMEDGTFINSFFHKGRSRFLLEDMPVYLILNPEVGLIGATAFASTLINN